MIRIVKFIFLIIFPLLLLVVTYGTYHYGVRHSLFEAKDIPSLSYDIYEHHKNSLWANRFEYQEENDYNTIKRKIIGTNHSILQVRRGYEKYSIDYKS
jgi:hypothetical protein